VVHIFTLIDESQKNLTDSLLLLIFNMAVLPLWIYGYDHMIVQQCLISFLEHMVIPYKIDTIYTFELLNFFQFRTLAPPC